MIQRRVEEHRITLGQRQLHVMLGEEVDELRPVEGEVAAFESRENGNSTTRLALPAACWSAATEIWSVSKMAYGAARGGVRESGARSILRKKTDLRVA